MSTQTDTTEGASGDDRRALAAVGRWVSAHWLGGWTVLVMLFLYTPIIVIVVFSFEEGAFSNLPWDGFTLTWYRQLLSNSQAMNSIVNSLYVAFFVTTVGTILGTLGAVALVRRNFRLKGIYRTLVLAPMTIPGLILGVAILMMFNYLEVTRTLRTVIIAQLVFVVPFVVVTVSSRLRGFDPLLEEAARDLGASRWTVFRRITLPLLAPGIISGALFAFSLSFDDFLIAFFTSGVQNTLPVFIFSTINRATSPIVNSISTLAFVISMTVIAASQYFQD
ncbi:spermidine/putrescine transport system permease protein [Halarchaeum solikamskense]|uniref:ABC transporter permease n=1 Tax=Halarchaeum nitratireducens TaxID=489913 RepID=UPI001B3AFECA|nr:ABC transporter permease [Halarchaeum solikamskense]MBP2252403.1 spermidine/putrescine transport system permease protein [Halarchaeum solikamskense]